MPRGRWYRTLAVPALALAYPLTFAASRRLPAGWAPVSDPVTLAAISALVLSGSVMAAAVLSRSLGLDRWAESSGLVGLVLCPPRSVVAALGLAFATFLGFLLLDVSAASTGEVASVLLPLSWIAFLPLWVAYLATFGLGFLGLSWLPPVVVRGAVVALGLGLSVPWQALLFGAAARAGSIARRRAGDSASRR